MPLPQKTAGYEGFESVQYIYIAFFFSRTLAIRRCCTPEIIDTNIKGTSVEHLSIYNNYAGYEIISTITKDLISEIYYS